MGMLGLQEEVKLTPEQEREKEQRTNQQRREQTSKSLVVVLIGGILLSVLYLSARIRETHVEAAGPVKAVAVRAKPEATPAARPLAQTSTSKAVAAVSAPAVNPVAAPVSGVKNEKELKLPPMTVASSAEGGVAPKAYDGPLTRPEHGQLYLQLAAIPPSYTPAFLTLLRSRGFAPSVAAGPDDHTVRVLIGPYGTEDVGKAREKVTSAKLEYFERRY